MKSFGQGDSTGRPGGDKRASGSWVVFRRTTQEPWLGWSGVAVPGCPAGSSGSGTLYFCVAGTCIPLCWPLNIGTVALTDEIMLMMMVVIVIIIMMHKLVSVLCLLFPVMMLALRQLLNYFITPSSDQSSPLPFFHLFCSRRSFVHLFSPLRIVFIIAVSSLNCPHYVINFCLFSYQASVYLCSI